MVPKNEMNHSIGKVVRIERTDNGLIITATVTEEFQRTIKRVKYIWHCERKRMTRKRKTK